MEWICWIWIIIDKVFVVVYSRVYDCGIFMLRIIIYMIFLFKGFVFIFLKYLEIKNKIVWY